MIAVLLQEAIRYAFFVVYSWLKTRLDASPIFHKSIPLNDVTAAVATGIGFGSMNTIVMYGSILSTVGGDGTLYHEMCPQISLFLVSCEF